MEFSDLTIDSTNVVDHQFTFKGVLEAPAKYKIHDDSGLYLFAWLENGKTAIQGDVSDFFNAKIIGGDFHKTSRLYYDSLYAQRAYSSILKDTLHRFNKAVDPIKWAKFLEAESEIDSRYFPLITNSINTGSLSASLLLIDA